MKEDIQKKIDSLNQGLTNITLFWKIDLEQGSQIKLVSAPIDVSINGDTYQKSCLCEINDLIFFENNQGSNFLFFGCIQDAGDLSYKSILQGSLINAFVSVSIGTLNKKEQFLLFLCSGSIVKTGLTGNQFEAETRDLNNVSSPFIGSKCSLTCRTNFGSSECSSSYANLSFIGTVDNYINPQEIIDPSLSEKKNIYAGGLITFLSGKNKGKSFRITSNIESKITFQNTLPLPVSIGDRYRINTACDKTFATCKYQYGNQNNFRGEPFTKII